MTIVFTVCLPRDKASVPVVRHVFHNSMEKLGIDQECLDDMELAVTEACTNVLQHASGTNEQYEVAVEVNERNCEIRITDTGSGFDDSSVAVADNAAESGRGIQLMRALVDKVKFASRPEQGTIVYLIKELKLSKNSPLISLTASAPS